MKHVCYQSLVEIESTWVFFFKKLFQMKFEDQTAGKIFIAVQLYYGVDVVFPEAVLKTTIYRFAIIFKLFTALLIKEIGDRENRKLAPIAGPFNG